MGRGLEQRTVEYLYLEDRRFLRQGIKHLRQFHRVRFSVGIAESAVGLWRRTAAYTESTVQGPSAQKDDIEEQDAGNQELLSRVELYGWAYQYTRAERVEKIKRQLCGSKM